MSRAPRVLAQGLGHAYRRFLRPSRVSLSGLDLEVQAGECWGVVGPNGSGKSTLLRLLAGLAVPRAGRAFVDGAPAGSRAARRVVGYCPESVRWPGRQSVGGALLELAGLTGWRGAGERVERAAAVTGLAQLLGRRLGSLSFGQARRVAMAQALLDEPGVLLLDDPFAGLDSLVIHDMRRALFERRERGAALLLATHRLEDLAGLASHLLVLRDGRVVERGCVAELLPAEERRDALVALLGGGT